LAGEGGAKLWLGGGHFEEKVRTWVSRLHQAVCAPSAARTVQFKLQLLAHQDHEQLSSRQVAAFDIRNPNRSWSGGAIRSGCLQACETRNEEQPR
jgi:transposase